jgi:hypothetical protein
MTRHTILALASLGCAALTTGCQNSGHAEADVEYRDRPRMTSTYTRTDTSTANTAGYSASASVDTTAYTLPVTVTRETSYMTSPTGTTTAGTLRNGDTVYIRSGTTLDTSANNGYVAAKTSDNRIVYVRATDLRMR